MWGLWMKVETPYEPTDPQRVLSRCDWAQCCLVDHPCAQARGQDVGNVPPPEINQRGRRGPKEPLHPLQHRQAWMLSLQRPSRSTEPSLWSCSNADLPYQLFTFLYIFSPDSLFCLGRKEGTAPQCNCLADILPPPPNLDVSVMLHEKCQLSNWPLTSQHSCFLFSKEPSLWYYCVLNIDTHFFP